jgi:hypothetical protein
VQTSFFLEEIRESPENEQEVQLPSMEFLAPSVPVGASFFPPMFHFVWQKVLARNRQHFQKVTV